MAEALKLKIECMTDAFTCLFDQYISFMYLSSFSIRKIIVHIAIDFDDLKLFHIFCSFNLLMLQFILNVMNVKTHVCTRV